ncbi:uncharacterized protein BDR25DRAFT_12861 [Lindgomyces ingoldianus]|uniref:Uncharacterized protein n=1 Tax=Lindgomyces ingoldianus TaxID=673940 RepID=A0ACB6R3Q9_9PLEO|nr:uncharacterized protein BDR25DRAFT_12861 [Lindgomyces ingoldianus]KAF2472957.1 hypothetical protein BDR25DRAFT_12861 [Lindgomyces ingoldianus]
MSYTVYLRENIGAARNHHVIFVQTESDGAGYVFQVTGNIQQGMAFDHKWAKKFEESETCIGQQEIGTVTEANFDRIQSIVETLPPPPKQFNGPTRIDPSIPLRRCQEWTADAIQLLRDAGVLES